MSRDRPWEELILPEMSEANHGNRQPHPPLSVLGLLLVQVLLMWTGKQLSMHVCVAQAPAGKIDWSANEQKSLYANRTKWRHMD